MSNGVVRLGDKCTGHTDFLPRKSITASSKVFANGVGIVRVGDKWERHCRGSSCHDGYQAQGSAKVYVDGRPIARKGDSISCGSKCDISSSKVSSN